MTNRSKTARAALMAALMALASVPVPAAPTTTDAQVQSGQEKAQAPTPNPGTPADLAFLERLGSPIRIRHRGYYWPGRKVACMLRRAGRVKRMRH